MATEYIRYPVNSGGGAGVDSLNGLTGALTLTAGSNITITPAGNVLTIASTGTGTVSSVALSAPTDFVVSGSPITSSGTLGLTYALQNQNLVLASPSGATGAPTFRSLVAGDIPSLSATYVPIAGGTMTGPLVLYGDGVSGNDAVTMNQLNVVISGIRGIGMAFAATTPADGNKALTGPVTADGQVVPNGQDVLLQFQTNGIENGCWKVNTAGAWTRSSFLANGNDAAGAYAGITFGPTYGGTFRLQNIYPCVVGTDAETWTFFGTQLYFADNSTLQLTGNTFSVKPNGIGPTQLQATGVTPGTYTPTTITVNAAGQITGVNASGSSIIASAYDDFFGPSFIGVNVYGGGLGALSSITGYPAVASVFPAPGVATMTTGTTATGFTMIGQSGNAYSALGGGTAQTYETRIQFPVISTAAQRFTFNAGFTNSNSAQGANSLCFIYSDTINAGAWQLMSSNGATVVNTAVTVAANTWYKLTIVVNAAASSASFYINGVLAGTITTNIPSGTAKLGSWRNQLYKSVGVTPIIAYADYISITAFLGTPR